MFKDMKQRARYPLNYFTSSAYYKEEKTVNKYNEYITTFFAILSKFYSAHRRLS